MNFFLLAGIVLSVLAAISTGIGTTIQAKKENEHQEKVESFVTAQSEKERPVLQVTGARLIDNERAMLVINNSGLQPADEVRIITTLHPNMMVRSAMSVLKKVPNGTSVNATFDMWQSDLTSKIGGDLLENRDSWNQFLKEYQAGEKALVIHFHLEYEHNGNSYKSEDYALLQTGSEFFFSSI